MRDWIPRISSVFVKIPSKLINIRYAVRSVRTTSIVLPCTERIRVIAEGFVRNLLIPHALSLHWSVREHAEWRQRTSPWPSIWYTMHSAPTMEYPEPGTRNKYLYDESHHSTNLMWAPLVCARHRLYIFPEADFINKEVLSLVSWESSNFNQDWVTKNRVWIAVILGFSGEKMTAHREKKCMKRIDDRYCFW